ncbi:hypothetical protein FRC03_008505 [Tulasnella sp. 419]|nr:hypothetical protein FRC03_008505 [Tulasnella sp. 419]
MLLGVPDVVQIGQPKSTGFISVSLSNLIPAGQRVDHSGQVGIAAAYEDLLPSTVPIPDDIAGNPSVKTVLQSGIDWWYENDFTEPFCLDQGSLTNATCPCGTPGLWNMNWFSNVILIPRQAAQTCLVLNDVITPEERADCIAMGERGYGVMDRWVVGIGYITGANTLDIASNGISVGLLRYLGGLDGGQEIVTDAYNRIHRDLVIHNEDKADGIRADGSFGQHLGLLYNGNYGKD